MNTHITETKYGTLQYQRRVPKPLIDYVSTKRFRVSLGTDDVQATQMALQYNKQIDNALKLLSLGLPSSLVLLALKGLISQDKAEQRQKHKQESVLFSSIAKSHLDAKRGTISIHDMSNHEDFFFRVCPPIFKQLLGTNNPKIKEITYNDLLRFKSILILMPKRNIHKYRIMKVETILKRLDDVPIEQRIAPKTINKFIKWLRAIYNLALILGKVHVNLANNITTIPVEDARFQRLPLDADEITQISNTMPEDKRYLFHVLKYTGMRLSELYKCKVETIEDIPCFSLLDKTIKLKTRSSYRMIPIHPALMEELGRLEMYRYKITPDTLSRHTTKAIRKLAFQNAHKKSLYSLRHTFATTLIQQGGDSNIVSELLGHNHTTQTLSRYATGYSPKQLLEVILLLPH